GGQSDLTRLGGRLRRRPLRRLRGQRLVTQRDGRVERLGRLRRGERGGGSGDIACREIGRGDRLLGRQRGDGGARGGQEIRRRQRGRRRPRHADGVSGEE